MLADTRPAAHAGAGPPRALPAATSPGDSRLFGDASVMVRSKHVI